MPNDHDHDHDGHDHEHDHDEELEDGEFDDDDDGIVVLTDAEGDEREFQFLDVVEVDDMQFALLAPVMDEENDDEDEPAEIFIFRYEVNEDGVETFSDVEDEALFAKVRDAAEALFAAEDEDDA
jgi:uncharacterized protein YrzB (UPF0473 family)